jgi:pimeloyl-ACP methyl ester carboxylesterase
MPERISVDGLSLTTVEGRGAASGAVERPPILLVHGWLAGAWMWEGTQQLLATLGWTSHALDLRGHGASAPVRDVGRVPLAAYVEDALRAAAAIRDAAGAAPVVIGHSMGGLIAQKLAEAGAVSAAVLVSPVPPRGILLMGARLAARFVRHVPRLLFSRPVRFSYGDAEALALNKVPPEARHRLHARLVAGSGRAARDMLLGVPVDPARVRCPMLVVGTSADRFVPVRIARQMAARYGVPFREYFGNAHLFPAEPRWDAAVREIEHWLDHALGVGGHEEPGIIRMQELAHQRGKAVTLSFRDGHVVLARIVSVDFEPPSEVIYEVLAVMEVGPPHLADVKPGRVAAAPLEEIRDFSVPVESPAPRAATS